MINKYANFIGGYKFLVSVEDETCPWFCSKSVQMWVDAQLDNVKISTTNKTMKQYGLDNINNMLESVYWSLVDVKALDNKSFYVTVDKDARKAIASDFYKKTLALYKALGCCESSRNMLWCEEYTLVSNCLATTGSTKTVLSRTGLRVDCTSFTSFKNAFYNALYNAIIGFDVLALTDKKQEAREKFNAKMAKLANAKKTK